MKERLQRLYQSAHAALFPKPQYYCDYAAATPVSPAVMWRMARAQWRYFANPSAVHQPGAAAAAVIADSRQQLARALGVRAAEITYTASGSEANNLAVRGVIEAKVAAGARYDELSIVTTRTEHPSVLAVVAALAARGVRVDYLPVTNEGYIDGAALKARLAAPATLVSFAYANSEVGVVQPVRRLVRAIKQVQPNTLVHLDAAQAPLWLTCNRHQLGVDLLSLDAGKCNGPKGVGVLVATETVALAPVIYGGGQERGRRAGTENIAGIVGATLAIVAAQATYETRRARVYPKTQALVQALTKHVPGVVFNGPAFTDSVDTLQRLPNNVHISLPGFDTEYAVIYLDTHRIAASTKSACSGAGGGRSEVVYEMTGDTALASSTIRFSLDPKLKGDFARHIAQTLVEFCELQQRVD
jgi:cysteine desulfurase